MKIDKWDKLAISSIVTLLLIAIYSFVPWNTHSKIEIILEGLNNIYLLIIYPIHIIFSKK